MKRLLIVDDDPDVLEGLQALLEGRFELCLAHDGAEALQRMEEGFRPDAILLDFMMPVMDGGELVAELRRRGVTAPVLLASAYPGLERRARDLGVAGSIAKPFRYQALEAKLRSVLGEPGGPRGPGSPLPGTRAFRLPDWNGWWHWGPRRRAPLAPFLV